MNTYIRLLIGLLLSSLLLTSCEQEAPKIVDVQLSTNELTFGRAIETQEVNVVATNICGAPEQWTYTVTPQVEWLKLSANEGKLNVSAEENATGNVRKASIAILAGNAIKHIEVSQKAADLLLNLGLNEEQAGTTSEERVVVFATAGEEKFVEINTNKEEWSVVPPAEDWLQAVPLRDSYAVKIITQPNPDTTPRRAVITINSGDVSTSFTVEQKGQLVYFLPYLGNPKKFNLNDLYTYESERGFRFLGVIQSDRRYGNSDEYYFMSASPKLPRLKYITRDNSNFAYDEATIDLSDSTEFQAGGGYYNYLKEIGFKERYNSTPLKPIMVSPDGYLLAKLMYEKKIKRPYVQFERQYVPDVPMPTWDKLPSYPEEVERMHYDNLSMYPEIDAWEIAQGSKSVVAINIRKQFGSRYPDEWYLAIYQTNNETEVSKKEFRFYEFANSFDRPKPVAEKIGLVKSLRLCYNDIEKAIFITDAKKNMFRTTPEFEALAEKEGFIFHGMNDKGVSFVNQEKGLKMVVLMFVDPSIFEASRTVTIRYEKLPPEPNTANAATTSGTSSVEASSAMATFGSPFSPNHNR